MKWFHVLELAMLISAAWVIYDVYRVNTKLSHGQRVGWTIAAILFNIVTAVVYYYREKKD